MAHAGHNLVQNPGQPDRGGRRPSSGVLSGAWAGGDGGRGLVDDPQDRLALGAHERQAQGPGPFAAEPGFRTASLMYWTNFGWTSRWERREPAVDLRRLGPVALPGQLRNTDSPPGRRCPCRPPIHRFPAPHSPTPGRPPREDRVTPADGVVKIGDAAGVSRAFFSATKFRWSASVANSSGGGHCPADRIVVNHDKQSGRPPPSGNGGFWGIRGPVHHGRHQHEAVESEARSPSRT